MEKLIYQVLALILALALVFVLDELHLAEEQLRIYRAQEKTNEFLLELQDERIKKLKQLYTDCWSQEV